MTAWDIFCYGFAGTLGICVGAALGIFIIGAAVGALEAVL